MEWPDLPTRSRRSTDWWACFCIMCEAHTSKLPMAPKLKTQSPQNFRLQPPVFLRAPKNSHRSTASSFTLGRKLTLPFVTLFEISNRLSWNLQHFVITLLISLWRLFSFYSLSSIHFRLNLPGLNLSQDYVCCTPTLESKYNKVRLFPEEENRIYVGSPQPMMLQRFSHQCPGRFSGINRSRS